MRIKELGVWKTKEKKSLKILQDIMNARKTNGKYKKEKH